MDEEEKYTKEGDAGRKGSSYELHLMLVGLLHCLRSNKKDVPEFSDFRVSVQNADVHKAFNDVIVEYDYDQQEKTYRKGLFFQSKHTNKAKGAKFNATNQTQLKYHLAAYLEIRQKYQVEYVIMYTTAKLNTEICDKINSPSALHFANCETVYTLNYDKLVSYKRPDGRNLLEDGKVLLDGESFDPEDVRDFFEHLIIAMEQQTEEKLFAKFELKLTEFSNEFQLFLPSGSADIIKNIMDEVYKNEKAKTNYWKLKNATQLLYRCFSSKVRNQFDDYTIYNFSYNCPALKKGSSSLEYNVHMSTEATTMYVAAVCQQLERLGYKYLISNIDYLHYVVDAFAHTMYTTLVLYFEREFEISIEVSEKLKNTLLNKEYKKMIIIGSEKYRGVKILKETVKANTEHQCISPTDDTLEKIYMKPVVFQGCEVSFSDIICDMGKETYKENTFNCLMKNKKLTVGRDVRRTKNVYIDRRFEYMPKTGIQVVDESQLLKMTEKFIIIFGSSGIGKSTTLGRFLTFLKSRHKGALLSMLKFVDILRLALNKNLGYIFEKAFRGETGTELELSKLICDHSKKILIVDDLEEIRDRECIKFVLETVKKIADSSNVIQLIMTCREQSLGEIIGTFQPYALYKLMPFVEEEQEEALIRFWDVEPTERVHTFAKAVIGLLKEMHLKNEFFGVPQQLKMMANVFKSNNASDWEGLNQFLTSGSSEPKLSTSYDLLQLYEEFINVHIERQMKKDAIRKKYALRILKECVWVHYTHFCVEHVLPSHKQLILNQHISPMKNTGEKIEQKLRFLHEALEHRTIVEYVVVKTLYEILASDDNRVKEIAKVVFDEVLAGVDNLLTMRHFFNLFFKRSNLERIARTNILELVELEVQQRALYLAVIWGNLHTVKFLLKTSPICVAIVKSNGGFGENKLVRDPDGSNSVQCWRYSPLMAAAFCGHEDVVQCLVQEGGAPVQAKDCDGNTALHYTFFRSIYVRLDSYEDTLPGIQNISGIKEICEDDELTLLDYYSRKEFYENFPTSHSICKFLLQNGANANIENRAKFTPHFLAKLGQDMSSVEEIENNLSKNSANADSIISDSDYLLPRRRTTTLSMGRTSRSRSYLTKVGVPEQNVQGNLYLHMAALKGNLDACRFLLGEGVDLNLRDDDGRTAIHCAVQCGSVKLVRFLAERGAKIDIADGGGRTPLHVAILYNKLEVAQFLVDSGADRATPDGGGSSPVHLAAASGDERILRLLVGARPRLGLLRDERMRTPLHIAAARRNARACAVLLADGAPVDARDVRGRTVLHFLAGQRPSPGEDCYREHDGSDDEDICRLLLLHGASAASRDSQRRTPLHLAVRAGNAAVWRPLLERCSTADLDAADEDGRVALHDAAALGDAVALRALLREGARADAVDRAGDGALHCVAERGGAEAARLLVDAGAPAAAANGRGRTPLHVAAHHDNRAVCRRLLALPEVLASLDARDLRGSTAAHLAAAAGHPDLLRLLLEAGSATETKDARGRTPLLAAAALGRAAACRRLLAYGADAAAVDDARRGALHHAAAHARAGLELARVFDGLDLDGEDAFGRRPLHVAAAAGDAEMFGHLVKRGARADAVDALGRTAAHHAAEAGAVRVLEALLSGPRSSTPGRAATAARDAHGWTPLHWAAARGRLEACRLLVDGGAKAAAGDVLGRTALHYAERAAGGPHREVADLLRGRTPIMPSTSYAAAARA